jgi:two-component system phosphate regulon response regulator PhoB
MATFSKTPQTTLLIVDDNAEMRRLLKLTFNYGNYILFEATNGDQALELILKEKPDIILLDVMMPGYIDGFAVCKFIKSSSLKDSKVIMLTAKAQQEDRDTGKKLGADFYITKPFSPLALIDIVETIATQKKH